MPESAIGDAGVMLPLPLLHIPYNGIPVFLYKVSENAATLWVDLIILAIVIVRAHMIALTARDMDYPAFLPPPT